MLTRSRTGPAVGAVTVLVVTAMAILVGVGIAAAQLAFDYSPDRGPPGTIIEVSVSGCIQDGVAYEDVHISLTRHTASMDEYYKARETHPLRPDGSWSGPFTVPVDAPYDDYTFSATCQEQDTLVHVGEGPFVVTDPDATPSVEPTPTPSVTTSSPDPTPSPTPTTPAPEPEPEPEPTPSVSTASPGPSPTRARPSTSRPSPSDPAASEPTVTASPATVLPSETADPAATDAPGRSSNTVEIVAGALTLLAVGTALLLVWRHRRRDDLAPDRDD